MKVLKCFFVVPACFLALLLLTAAQGHGHTITASAGVGGTISPSGNVSVTEGADQTFTIFPYLGYEILDIVTDEGSQGAVSSYTFGNVISDNSITASFSACSDPSPVMLPGSGHFDTIMEANDAAYQLGLDTILLRAGRVTVENFDFGSGASIKLIGGHDCSFQNSYTFTKIPGSITISSGTLILSNIRITPVPPPEICDGLDNDDDGQIDEGLTFDVDEDGFTSLGSCEGSADDCDDNDPDIFPGNSEICDGKDNNCDGGVDEGLTFDVDEDGFTSVGSCEGSADDCDDNDPDIFPGNPEICDGKDNNCDGGVDEGLTFDVDEDGFTSVGSCEGSADDCNDNNGGVHPGAVEVTADGIDQDCDGLDFPELGSLSCDECHLPYDDYIDLHDDKVAAPDGTCTNCHSLTVSNVLNGHYGKTVRTSGNNMTAGSIIECTSCHDMDDGLDHSGDYIVWAKVEAVGMGNETCDTCHEDRAAAHQTGTAHDNRVIDNWCGQCHTSDTSILGFPGAGTLATSGDVDTLHRSDCTLCHNYTGTKLDQQTVKQAILDGLDGTTITCTTCHQYTPSTIHPFVLDHHTGIVTASGTTCSTCHTSSALIDATDPKVHDDCTTCHDAYGNLIDLAEGKSAPGNCITCHGTGFDDVHLDTIDHTAIVTVVGTICADCHTNQPPLVDPLDPKVHNYCSNCHDDEGGLIDLAAGKSFSVGGDCTTCHGDHFTSHTHHNGTNNDVSYDPAFDTSQTSEQGCAVCHHDYDLVNGTSLGLDTWETILVEHDLDGTKDGSTNTCDNCHAYDGSASPPQAAVLDAINSGNPATCATCHTDKVPDVAHGIPPTGKHETHFGMAGVSCDSCHNINYFPFFKSGTDANGDGLYNLAEADVCYNCHQDGSGNPAQDDFKSGWSDPDFVLACTSCHELPPDTGTHLTHFNSDVGWKSMEITFATSTYLTSTIPASTLYLRIVIDPSVTNFWNKHRRLKPKQVRFSYQDTLLPFKVEAWNSDEDEAIFIVQQPELLVGTDIAITLHYGAIGAAELDFGNVFPATIKSYYPLDANCPSEDGGYLANLVDPAYNLTEYLAGNTTTMVDGHGHGKARHFNDSITPQGLYSPPFDALDPYGSEEMIVAYSFRHPSTSGVYEQIMNYSKYGQPYTNWSVYLNPSATIQFALTDTNTGGAIATSNEAIGDNIWERRLGFYNGNETHTDMKTYRDGSIAGSGTGTWNAFEQLYDTSGYQLGIGYTAASPGNGVKDGDIDSIVIIKGLAVTDDIAVFDNQNQLQAWVAFGQQGTELPPGASPPQEFTVVYGDLRDTADFMAGQVSIINLIGCGNCHPLDPLYHGNGVWGDVELANIAAPAGSLKSLTLNGSYDQATGTCSSVYCHSANSWTTDGEVPMPWPEATGWDKNIDPLPRPLPDNINTVRVYKDVTWNSGETLTCDGCHDNPPQTTAVDNDGGAGDSHSWIDPYGYENLHAWNMNFPAIGCRTCHYDTVQDASVIDYDDVNFRRYYHDVAIYDKAKHVNGSVDVTFDTVHNFTYPPSEYRGTDITYDLSLASFDPASKTCSNVGCHWQQTAVTWGLPYRWYQGYWDYPMNNVECDRCHGLYDTYQGECLGCH